MVYRIFTFSIIETIVVSITISISNGIAIPAKSSITNERTQIGCPCCGLALTSLPWKWCPGIYSVDWSEPVVWNSWCWCMRLSMTGRSIDTASGVYSTVSWSTAGLGWVSIMSRWNCLWDWERWAWWFWLVVVVIFVVLFLFLVSKTIIVNIIVWVIATKVVVVVIIIVRWEVSE